MSEASSKPNDDRLDRRVFPANVQPAMTIVIIGIYDEAWLLEIEAVAAG